MTIHSHSEVPTRGFSFLHLGYLSASAMQSPRTFVPFVCALVVGFIFIRIKDETYQMGGLCSLGLSLLFGIAAFGF